MRKERIFNKTTITLFIIMLLSLFFIPQVVEAAGGRDYKGFGEGASGGGKTSSIRWYKGRYNWDSRLTGEQNGKKVTKTLGEWIQNRTKYTRAGDLYKIGTREKFNNTCSYINSSGKRVMSEWVMEASWTGRSNGKNLKNWHAGASARSYTQPSKIRVRDGKPLTTAEINALKNKFQEKQLTVICSTQIYGKNQPGLTPDPVVSDEPTPTPGTTPGTTPGLTPDPSGDVPTTKEDIKVSNPCPVPETKTITESNPKAVSVTGVYATYTKIIANKPTGYLTMSSADKKLWDETHKDQIVEAELTELGKLLEKLGVNMTKTSTPGIINISPEDWKNNKDAIIAAAKKPAPDMKVELSEENQKGFANGGLFTIVENEMKVTLTVSTETDKQTSYSCEYTGDKTLLGRYPKEEYNKPAPQPGIEVIDGGTTWNVYKIAPKTTSTTSEVDTRITDVFVKPHTWETSKSYQLIGVRCNSLALKDALNGGTILSDSVSSGKMSIAAKSPVIDKAISTHFNGINNVAFYFDGKSCNLQCSPDPGTNSGNDSSNNVRNTKPAKTPNENLYGAQSNDMVSSEFQYFRDNSPKEIRTDIWRILSPNVKEMKSVNNEANKTVFIADPKGTPKHKEYTVTAKHSGKMLEIFNGEKLTPAWVGPGQINKINVKADWASDINFPHKLNLKYVYRPEIAAYTPITFSTDGIILENGQENTLIDYVCDVNFNTTAKNKAKTYIKLVNDNELRSLPFSNNVNDTLSIKFVKSSKE